MSANISKAKPWHREIVIKFREGGALFEEKNGQLRSEHLKLEKFYNTVRPVKGAEVRRSFQMEIRHIREMQKCAGKRLKKPIPSLDLFVHVRVPEGEDLEALTKKFADDPEVEYTYVAGIWKPASRCNLTHPAQPYGLTCQHYLDPAADGGVDAYYAWDIDGGAGSEIKVCVIDDGFNPEHTEFNDSNGSRVEVVSNLDDDLSQDAAHGTRVLGVLASKNDGQGITGICYDATVLFASCSGGHAIDSLTDAINKLEKGDVLVLPLEIDGLPLEYNMLVHSILRTAVWGKDIVVVEAAGNGGRDLKNELVSVWRYDADSKEGEAISENMKIWDMDNYDNYVGYNDPDRFHPDSGAIIVGGGNSIRIEPPHLYGSNSNYGNRVTCQGWGASVVTTTSDDDHGGDIINSIAPTNQYYANNFRATSSATPIVAGVVACLQGAVLKKWGAKLSPESIRELLKETDIKGIPLNGTPQADSALYPVARYHIGPLPDLRRLLIAAGINSGSRPSLKFLD